MSSGVSGAVLDQERRGLPAADQGELAGRLGDAPALQGLQRRQEQLRAVARRQLQPAGDREIAAGREVIEISPERLDRVDEALAETDRAGGRGGEGVEQRNLDQIVAVRARGDEAARLADVHPDVGPLVQMAREIGVAAADQIDQLRVQLDRVDRARLVVQREQHVRAAARSEHQDARPVEQVVRQRGGGEIQIGERPEVAVERGDRAQPLAVGEHADLLGRLDQIVQAQPRRVAERDLRTAHRAEQTERARALDLDLGAGHAQRLAQALVRRELQGGPRGRQRERHGAAPAA